MVLSPRPAHYKSPSHYVLRTSFYESIHEFDIDGDYKVSALERTMDNDHIRAQLLESYTKLAKGKKGIILDNVGMYATFGLPDADRPWEVFICAEFS